MVLAWLCKHWTHVLSPAVGCRLRFWRWVSPSLALRQSGGGTRHIYNEISASYRDLCKRNSTGKYPTAQRGQEDREGRERGRGSGFFPKEVIHHLVEREAKSARYTATYQTRSWRQTELGFWFSLVLCTDPKAQEHGRIALCVSTLNGQGKCHSDDAI